MLINAAARPAAPGRSSDAVARYNLFNAWPAATSGRGNNVRQQEWTLVYEAIQR